MNISHPTLLLDEKTARENLKRMVERARRNNVALAPHFKSHQSRAIALWCKEAGIDECTVSSMSMAAYFQDWDVFIAFPLNVLEIPMLPAIRGHRSITVLVNSRQTAEALKKSGSDVMFYIEIDSGYGRTGLTPDDEEISRILEVLEPSTCHFRGFYTHAGHTYACRSQACITAVHAEVLKKMATVGGTFGGELSLGDTPSCSTQESFEGISVIRPGNFIFYDLTQAQIGSCDERQIAVVLAAPIVFKSPGKLVIYGGGVHLCKDYLDTTEGRTYGKMVRVSSSGRSEPISGCNVTAISQEHGTIDVSDEAYNDLEIGDVVGILPVHACMTADSMGGYLTFDGQVLDHARGRNLPILPI